MGYSGWHNVGNTYLSDAVQEVLGIKNKIENPLHTLHVHNYSVIYQGCKKYPIIWQAIARVIDLRGKQGLAIKRHRWTNQIFLQTVKT